MYQIYIDNYLLPVTPGKLEIKISNNNKTETLINDGEINVVKAPGLSDFSFGVLLPRSSAPYASYLSGFLEPEIYLSLFEIIKTECRAFDLKMIRLREDGQSIASDSIIHCTLEDYTITEDVEKYGLDVYVDLKFKQYRHFGTYIVKTDSDGNAVAETTRYSGSHTIPEFYTIKENDTLWSIAKVQLGDAEKRFYLYELNKKVLDDAAVVHGKSSCGQGNLLYAGTVIRLKEHEAGPMENLIDRINDKADKTRKIIYALTH